MKKRWPAVWLHFVRRLIEITSRQQQTQRTLLDWLRVENEIEKPSNKLLGLAELDSDAWVGKVKLAYKRPAFSALAGAGYSSQ